MDKAAKLTAPIESSMFGPSPWAPGYDVDARMDELEFFWKAGVTAALFDAMRRAEETSDVPDWVWAGCRKVVEDRLRAGFGTDAKTGKCNDEKKLYKARIRNYYRWRAVWKHRRQNGATWEGAYIKACEELTGTFAKGSPETMKTCYAKISRQLKDESTAYLYYSAMPETRLITNTSLIPAP